MRFAIHVAQDLLEHVSFANYKIGKRMRCYACRQWKLGDRCSKKKWSKLATGECIICYANTMYWT